VLRGGWTRPSRNVVNRIAADLDELARAPAGGDLDIGAVLPGRRAERRRRLAEPDPEFRAFCTRQGLPASSTLQPERAWEGPGDGNEAPTGGRVGTMRNGL
jgi:hypothetical protein